MKSTRNAGPALRYATQESFIRNADVTWVNDRFEADARDASLRLNAEVARRGAHGEAPANTLALDAQTKALLANA